MEQDFRCLLVPRFYFLRPSLLFFAHDLILKTMCLLTCFSHINFFSHNDERWKLQNYLPVREEGGGGSRLMLVWTDQSSVAPADGESFFTLAAL